MSRIVYSILLCSGVLFSACGNESTTNNTTETNTKETTPAPAAPAEKPQSNLGETGTEKLMQTLQQYYALKDALVASDAAQTTTVATSFIAEVEGLEHALNDPKHALSASLTTIKTEAKAIVAAKDDVEKQRIPFEKVSDAMYQLVSDAALKHAGIYRQYCPMAFNDKGAYWLSHEEHIRNPYFGKKMLTCGEVTDTLQ